MVKAPVMPNFFRCPLSLELMKDPVTLCTGQTYDRNSIETWFGSGHDTCPSTMQVLNTLDVVPNEHLRRLIDDWCVSNSKSTKWVASAAAVVPDGRRADVDLKQTFSQMRNPTKDPATILQNLRIQMKESNSKKQPLVEAGGVKMLSSFIYASVHQNQIDDSLEEALALLVLLPIDCIRAQQDIHPKLVTAMSWLLCRGSMNARVKAAEILTRLVTPSDKNGESANQDRMTNLVAASMGVFEGIVQLLKEEYCPRAQEAGLKACLALLQSRQIIVKGVEAGLTFAVIEFLSTSHGRSLERALAVLEVVSSTTEGRQAMSDHALTVAVLAKIVVQNSSETEKARAASCLWALCSPSEKISQQCLDEALTQEGLSSKLFDLSHNSCSSPANLAREQHVVFLKTLLLCRSRTCTRIELL